MPEFFNLFILSTVSLADPSNFSAPIKITSLNFFFKYFDVNKLNHELLLSKYTQSTIV